MLHYLGRGMRRYGYRPIPIYQRTVWEFQSVLRGKIGLILPDKPQPFRSRRLWIFPPQHAHGWKGMKNNAANVAVFHFPNVPEPLRERLGKRAFLEIPLNAEQCARLDLLAKKALSYSDMPASGMLLCHEQILLELSLIALEFEPAPQKAPKPSLKAIEIGLRWFSENMRHNPGLNQVARTSGVSSAHLRRLFQRTFQASPKQIFDQLRFQRATQLMSNPSIKLEAVSEQCGFGSASAFSRAFRNKFGYSPNTWRVRV